MRVNNILGSIRLSFWMLKLMSKLLTKLKYLLPFTYPSVLKSLIPRNSKSILDVGCGEGQLMEQINSKGEYEVTGVDVSKKDLAIAKKRKCIFMPNKFVYKDLLIRDITKKWRSKKKFDVVLCSQVVEHLQKEKALMLINRLEKLAGRVVIIGTINGFYQFDHRTPQSDHDLHLSGWKRRDFSSRDYRVFGHGLKFIYQPGYLKDILPHFFHPLLFVISYVATPALRFILFPALFLIASKTFNERP